MDLAEGDAVALGAFVASTVDKGNDAATGMALALAKSLLPYPIPFTGHGHHTAIVYSQDGNS